MRIPRQPGGSSEPSRGRGGGPDCPLAKPISGSGAVERLRRRRRDLVAEQRAIGYWQRLVQARVDLVVADLLYGVPVPVGAAGVPGPEPAATGASHVLTGLPAGLDPADLLGQDRTPDGSPAAQLERLRRAGVLLSDRRHVLDDELDAVTLALHDRLARDGAVLDGAVPGGASDS